MTFFRRPEAEMNFAQQPLEPLSRYGDRARMARQFTSQCESTMRSW